MRPQGAVKGDVFLNGCCWAIIAAAGSSSRMGGVESKQFLPLCGVPAVIHTLRAFEAAQTIDSVVVVCRPEDMDKMRELVCAYGVGKVAAIVPGRETRQRSVAEGLAALGAQADFVAVQDGARPLVLPGDIDACVQDAFLTGASALAAPVKDTVKMIGEDGYVTSTLPRASLRAVQTPQVFRRSFYEEALENARRQGGDYTDDCQLLEHFGVRVHLCDAGSENLKLTTREDICKAEAILRSRGKEKMRIGHGYDVHRLVEDRKLILAGVEIPFEKGLLGHSDADVLTHAIMDALLGAAALGDIGLLFPDKDPAYEGADSLVLLKTVCKQLHGKHFEISNIDGTVVAQAPKLRPYIEQMRRNLARACSIPVEAIGLKATTEEGLGFTGSGEGISAHAVCLIEQR